MLAFIRPSLITRFIALATCCTIFSFIIFSSHLKDSLPSHIIQLPHLSSASSAPLPKKLWYKLGPKGLSDEAHGWTDTCIKKNPHYEAKFLDDDSSDEWVRQKFIRKHRDLVETYLSLPIPILKADILRYLLLYMEGGIWFDLDVSCEGPLIDEWIPDEYKANSSIVVGWEFDAGWGEKIWRQFATWTIMSKPNIPHMRAVVEDIFQSIHNTTVKHNVSVEDLTLDMVGEIVDFTGPRRFTRNLLKSVELTTGAPVNNSDITNLLEPKMIADILILPGYSFAASANSYKEFGEKKVGPLLVEHHYAGSWKNSQGGETV